jgi:competence protein CoiA
MQLYALDQHNQIISSKQARKHQDYRCLECQGIVRVRQGDHRSHHFFHLKPEQSCRQEGKSLEHLQTQLYIQSILPEGECLLEHPFPPIKRIADAAWITKKIIFEVQCSPISWEELQKRNRDYASQGYQVVWILHQSRFNQWKLSAAELILDKSPHYYTNINQDGTGMIYDQFQMVQNGLRHRKLPAFPVDLSKPIFLPMDKNQTLPMFIQHRLKFWPLCFSGDLMTQSLAPSESFAVYLDSARILENEFLLNDASLKGLSFLKHLFYEYLLKPYDFIFKLLLEKACR